MIPRTLRSVVVLATLVVASSLGAAAAAVPVQRERVPVLVVTGANNHDWRWTSPRLFRMLRDSGKFAVTVTTTPAEDLADPQLGRYAAIVLDYNGPRWGEAAEARFLDAVENGTGVVVIHAANNAFPGWTEYERLVGHLWREGTGHGRFHAFDVVVTDRTHPVTQGLEGLTDHPDELYHDLVPMHEPSHRVLAVAMSSKESGGTGENEPMILVGSYGAGRVFHTPLGHVWPKDEASRASFEDPQFIELVVRGTEWAARGVVTPTAWADPNAITERDSAAGWRALFDGTSTAGWRGFRKEAFPEQGWSVEDGALRVHAGGGGGDVVTTEEFADFDLELEWKVAEGANSGIMYRVGEDAGAPWVTGPEYQILDDARHGDGGSALTAAGALYALLPADGKLLMPVGEYNVARVRMLQGHLDHWLNGVHVVSTWMNGPDWDAMVAKSKFKDYADFGRLPQGHIALQDHGDDVWFRGMRVREPQLVEPGRKLGEPVVLFAGTDLDRWTCHLPEGSELADVWSIDSEGVLVCKGQPVGYLRTKEDFTSYVLELDWRFDPVTKQAGNSGVLLRQVGEDKVWPKSVEAQLHSGNAGDFWNIGEFAMTADPHRTNGRNTKKTHANENEIGEWNHYRIVVDHDRVILEVNGEVVNMAVDVEEVPGKICLQSEGAEIHFRNVVLTPILD